MYQGLGVTEETKIKTSNFQEGIDFLLKHSQTLWNETSFKGLLKQFVNVLVDRFEITEIGITALNMEENKFSFDQSPIHFPNAQTISDEVLVDIKTQIGQHQISSKEFSDGINTFQCQGKSYSLVVVDRPTKEPCILIWKNREESVSSEFLTDANEYTYLDFLARQLQGECHWFRKLDSTQALLYRDDLTGLFNHRYLDIAIDNEIRRAGRFVNEFSILFIDLDNFKQINDNHGHLSGSSVLKQAADVLDDTIREIDVPIRYGGDEFVIVLLGTTSSKAQLVAERIRQKIAKTNFLLEDGDKTSLTVSIGIASYPDHSTEKSDLLKLADEAMYRSKGAGKNRVSIIGTHTGFFNKHVLKIVREHN